MVFKSKNPFLVVISAIGVFWMTGASMLSLAKVPLTQAKTYDGGPSTTIGKYIASILSTVILLILDRMFLVYLSNPNRKFRVWGIDIPIYPLQAIPLALGIAFGAAGVIVFYRSFP
jgi:hypothetical protein